MRTLCRNLYREDGLETVLEVPVPEEMFPSTQKSKSWQSMKTWMKYLTERSSPPVLGGRRAELQLLLGVVGAPLIPHPIPTHCRSSGRKKINDHPIEASMAKYIVQQYVAAAGGESALNAIDSMYAMGKVKMSASEFICGDGLGLNNNGKVMKVKSGKSGPGEMGGFVLWQKRPDLWSLELMVSGCKISAGSDGKVAWRQTPWHSSHASRGPPRPLRRALQGLDPKSTADLFSNSICTGEKTVNGEDCFVLKLEAEHCALRSRSRGNVEIIRHTVWGYFSQKTGLLVRLEDAHLLRIKSAAGDCFWETAMESAIRDYRTVNGVNIAHAGKTSVSLFRFGGNSQGHTRTRMEEAWSIEEVDFNIMGLSGDCFLPPSDLKKEDDGDDEEKCGYAVKNGVTGKLRLGMKIRDFGAGKGVSKIVAIEEDGYVNIEDYEEL
nr:uncharacterized protein LOC109147716 [Ipomoea trifida]